MTNIKQKSKRELLTGLGFYLMILGSLCFLFTVIMGEITRNPNDIYIVKLNKTSPEAFAEDVRDVYGIVILDVHGHLASSEGKKHMGIIETCLGRFTPEFIRKLVSVYNESGRRFIIRLEDYNNKDDVAGNVRRTDKALTIRLFYNVKAYDSFGISVDVLAHEIGHAITFLIQDDIGRGTLEAEMRAFNGDFDYVGEQYAEKWNRSKHSTTFVTAYAMSDYHEDIAEIFGFLIAYPSHIRRTVNNPDNEALRDKIKYIGRMTFLYVSIDGVMIFDMV
ncbi:MAG: putative zinc-binding metallopeptidase [Oscillospiraceae bacterium]|nr:putative zinc-binding metallopeptidase [Oscillospiraceae bacterium]